MPKSGFINTRDFKTPKQLSEYLKYLSQNQTAYESYFEWKKHVKFIDRKYASPLCNMCIHLQLESHFGIKQKVITSLNELWNVKEKCF